MRLTKSTSRGNGEKMEAFASSPTLASTYSWTRLHYGVQRVYKTKSRQYCDMGELAGRGHYT